MTTKKNISELLTDFAAVSGSLATFIGDRNPSDEEKKMMDRLLEIHSGLVFYAVWQTG